MDAQKNEKNHYTLEIIRDLKVLLPREEHPLIDQLEYYLEATQGASIIEKEGFLGIKKVVEKEILHALARACCKCEVLFDVDVNSHSLEKVIEILPLVGELIEIYQVTGLLKIFVKQEELQLEIIDFNQNELINRRSKIYRIYRKLLKKEIFLVYQFSQLSNEHRLLLQFHFSHNSDHFLHLKLDDLYHTEILFPYLLTKFRVNHNQLEALKGIPCLEINSQLHVKQYDQTPLSYLKQCMDGKWDKDILFFPFVFRPLVVVLPAWGRGVFKEDLDGEIIYLTGNSLGHTSSCFNDLLVEKSNLYYFDFFSFFNT